MSSTNTPERAPVRRHWSLAFRLTAWYAGSCFLLLVAGTGFLYYALRENLARSDDQYLTERIAFLRGLLRDHPEDRDELRREVQGVDAEVPNPRLFTRIVSARAEETLETHGMSRELPADKFPSPVDVDAIPDPAREVFRASSRRSYQLIAAHAPVGRGGQGVFTLQLALDRTAQENLLEAYRRSLVFVLGAGLVASTLLSYWLARRGLRPLAQVTAAAQRVRAATLHERIALAHLPAELAALGKQFNEMLDRLEDHLTRLARFSADIAHELRTPVNNMRSELEVSLSQPRGTEEYRDTLGSALEECGRLTRLIDSLLFLARAEDPKTQLVLERIDVAKELHLLRDFYSAAAEEKGIRLSVKAVAGLAADVDRTLFQRAVGNLIANALAHTPAGGTVSMCGTVVGNELRVEVIDTGPGIPAAHLPYVFDRFYRADPARSGSSGRVGLGLSIVKSIANLHRGSVHIASEEGEGTCVTLVFPEGASPAHAAAGPPPSAASSRGLKQVR